MSEQVSLDFLISLKQATQNVQQTRKIGGALDYLANLAKKANDALFETSSGEDADKKYDKASSKKQRLTSISANMMLAAASVTQKALNLTITGIRASVGWWAQHAGKMTLFRKEMGFAAEEVHQFSMGVLRSSAQYGTSMRSVRDLTFFMVRGAKLGAAEIESLTGALAELADFGGVDTGTIRDFMSTMTGFLQLMDESDATHMSLAIKAISQEFKVGADVILRGFSSVDELLPSFGAHAEKSYKLLASMFAQAQTFREDPQMIVGVFEAMGKSGSKMNRLLIAQKGDLNATLNIIMGQFDFIMKKYGDESGKLSVQGVEAVKRMGNHFEMSNLRVIKGMSLTYKGYLESISKVDKIWAQSSDALRVSIKANLTPIEEIHKAINRVKASAAGFWESFMGGKGGNLLFAALDKIEHALQYWELVWGSKGDPEDDAGKAKQSLAKARWAIYNPFSGLGIGARLALHKAATPENAARVFDQTQPGATFARREANNALAQFSTPAMAAHRGEASRYREELQKAGTRDEVQKILKALLELLNATGEGNRERKDQGAKKKNESLKPLSRAALAAEGKIKGR